MLSQEQHFDPRIILQLPVIAGLVKRREVLGLQPDMHFNIFPVFFLQGGQRQQVLFQIRAMHPCEKGIARKRRMIREPYTPRPEFYCPLYICLIGIGSRVLTAVGMDMKNVFPGQAQLHTPLSSQNQPRYQKTIR